MAQNENETHGAIIIGPFFTGVPSTRPRYGSVVPLNLAVEWATAERATCIELFRRVVSWAPNRIRFEHVLFRRNNLPCDLECQEYQVTNTEAGEFLPLDALLAALYRGKNICRPVFGLLNELVTFVPIVSTVSTPVPTTGLLVARAEAVGFRLNAIYEEPGTIFINIGWEPKGRVDRFHVCSAAFRKGSNGELSIGEWLKAEEIGVSEALSEELHRLAPCGPAGLLTEAGMRFLKNASKPLLPLPSITTPNTTTNENSVKSGVSRSL